MAVPDLQPAAQVYDYLFDDLTSDDSLADPTMDWSSYRDSFAPERLHTKEVHAHSSDLVTEVHIEAVDQHQVINEWVMVYVEEALRNAARAAGSEKDASILEMGCGKGGAPHSAARNCAAFQTSTETESSLHENRHVASEDGSTS